MRTNLTKGLLIFILILALVFSQGFYVYADGGVLKKGETSDAVKEVQLMLQKLGYFEGQCTGYFGDITEKAVKAFQKSNKLEADGIVGPETLKKLKALTASSPSRSTSISKSDSIVYTVKKGDTIWDIANIYGITQEALLESNSLTEKSTLNIGDKLIIPGVKKSEANNTNDNTVSSELTYVVQEGDCISSIAEDFGVPLASLLKLNNLTVDSILQIGQIIKIPNDDIATSDSEASTNLSENNDSGASNSISSDVKGEYLDWFNEVQYIFEKDDVATVTDVATGKTFKVKRMQGHNHADTEPLTADDTAVMKSLYGSWSWDRRAVIVTIDDHNIAGSMNGMPHGNQSISNNNFNGHFCIHFKNSKTHSSNKVDKTHQAMIKKAAGL